MSTRSGVTTRSKARSHQRANSPHSETATAGDKSVAQTTIERATATMSSGPEINTWSAGTTDTSYYTGSGTCRTIGDRRAKSTSSKENERVAPRNEVNAGSSNEPGEKRVPSGQQAQALGSMDVPRAASKRGKKSSVTMDRKRAELEARLRLEELELERTRAEATLARTKLELVRLDTEDEESTEAEDEADGVSSRIEDWVHNSRTSLYVTQKRPEKVSCRRRVSAPKDVQPRIEAEREKTSSEMKKKAMSYDEKDDKRSEITHLAEAIMNAVERKERNRKPALPKFLHDLPRFSGEVSEWIAFRAAYIDTEEHFTEIQNVARLRQALCGIAKDAVKAQLYVVSDPEEIMSALERRFGHPEHLILSELAGIRRMPRLADDGRNIGTFASRIANTVASIKALNKSQYLYSPELVHCIIEKMGTVIKLKWFDYKAQYPQMPDLERLSTFLNQLGEQLGSEAFYETLREPTKEDRKRYTKYDAKRKERKAVHLVQSYEASETEMEDEDSPSEIERDSDSDTSSTVERRRQVLATVQSKGQKVQVKKEPAPKNKESNNRKCAMCAEAHPMFKCEKFKTLSLDDRWDKAKETRTCFRCLNGSHRRWYCKAKPCGVDGCWKSHHKMLHNERKEIPQLQESGGKEVLEATVSSVNTINKESSTYLKIIPIDLYGPKGTVSTYALLDEGSTVTLIEEDTALAVAPRGSKEELRIEGVGGKKINDGGSYKIKLKIKGRFNRELHTMSAHTIKALNLSSQRVDKHLVNQCEHLKEVEDQLWYEQATPTVLIGQDNWHLIVSRELKTGPPNLPVASYTNLGWVLHGYITGQQRPVAFVNHLRSDSRVEENIENLIKEHFSIESLGVEPRKQKNDPDARALQLLENTCRRIPGGRYEVGLLWKTDNESFPTNRLQAEQRLRSIEKKLSKDAALKSEYEKLINNLIEKGYAEKVTPSTSINHRVWYLPHFAVKHPQKGKVRLVFDAAHRTAGKSLNDALLSGPDLLQSLFGVLVRFREGPIAVMADIREMFLQVKILKDDRDALRFLWRENTEKSPDEYRMTSLIFGATSSPCSAIYVKNKNASEHSNLYPEAAEATVKQFYMDDYLQAFPDEKTAQRVIKDIQKLHEAASFELRSWASNNKTVLRSVSDVKETAEASLGDKNVERTLGLIWNTDRDTLSFSLNLRNTPQEAIDGLRPPTKREVTSAVMSVFDPLGLASPITIQGKIVIQQLWRTGLGWDDPVPKELETQWHDWLLDLKKLKELEIPRYVPHTYTKGELHTFTDASERAYSTAVFWLATRADGSKTCILLAGKAKVAPLKPISIPRLELQAALLGCRLTAAVKKEMSYTVESSTYWTDSRTVLAWIQADPRVFKPFVAHRLAEIEDTTKPTQWRWVPTDKNVADDATRNTPNTFTTNHRWFHGPSFLYENPSTWPQTPPLTPEDHKIEEKKNSTCVVTYQKQQELPDASRFSSYKRLLYATARMIQCVEVFRRLAQPLHKNTTSCKTQNAKQQFKRAKTYLPLERHHLETAERLLINKVQNDCFRSEIKACQNKKPLDKTSKLRRLSTKIDAYGILRLDGRLNADKSLTSEYRAPAVLHAKHPIVQLIIFDTHCHFNHGNHLTVINELAQKYYVIALRNTLRSVIHKCQWCKVHKEKPRMAPQGDLPIERITREQPPFTSTAVDYFGPIIVTIGRRHEKRWGALFTCMTTRAVHLEVAHCLNSSSFIMALRRMIARRGTPRTIFSDNGTNFKGADKEMTEAINNINSEMSDAAKSRQIVWKFLPPGAPHMNGVCERMVQSVKRALAATLKDIKPRDEVLHTLLLEAEHLINSRPMVPVSADLDQEALTPNHFLIGRSCGARPAALLDDSEFLGPQTWKTAQRLADHFWARWIKEYLPTLLPRSHNNIMYYKSPRPDDVVLIVDQSLPRGAWPRGIVTQVFPGRDGRVRVAEVRTSAGLMRRPTTRMVILTNSTTENQSPAQKECVTTQGGDCRRLTP